VLGSRSSDLLSGLGPGPLRAGDRLRIGAAAPAGQPPGAAPAGQPPGADSPAQPGLSGRAAMPGAGGVTQLRVVPGPRADWFGAGALAVLCGEAYTVTAASNRTGLRLDGPALRRARAAELPSEGLVTGALQVPPDGMPILLLADHPVTGGYAVIAVVRSADIGLAAQLRPGQRIRFAVSR
jgi:allophanate hydrolase subunit 2